MLKITDVRIHLLHKEVANLRAYASVTIDASFVVHGIKVMEAERGIFVGMPRRRRDDGTTQDVCHPINQATRRYLEERVLAAYHQELAHPGSTRPGRLLAGEATTRTESDGPEGYAEL